MIFEIVGWTPNDTEQKITSVDAWYDRHTRLWVVQCLDADGYQVGDATYVYGKKDAMEVKADLERELSDEA